MHLNKLVKLSVWRSVTTFRTHMYMFSLNMAASTSRRSPRLVIQLKRLEAHKWSHLLSGKWEHVLRKPRNNCLVLFKSVWHHCLLSLKWLHWRLPTTLSMASLGTFSQSTRARISLNSFLCYTRNLVNVVYSSC